jgi:hypothetical protein
MRYYVGQNAAAIADALGVAAEVNRFVDRGPKQRLPAKDRKP